MSAQQHGKGSRIVAGVDGSPSSMSALHHAPCPVVVIRGQAQDD